MKVLSLWGSILFESAALRGTWTTLKVPSNCKIHTNGMIGHMWYSKESPMCKEKQVSIKLVEGNQYTWNGGESYKFDAD